MTNRVILTLIDDELEATIYEFTGNCRCLVGRAPDCDIRLAADRLHGEVSRHHCLFEIEPPFVRVLDLGSLKGTFVNGKQIGGLLVGEAPAGADLLAVARVELKDGDEVRIGSALFSVLIEETTTQTLRWPELIRNAKEMGRKGTRVAKREARSNPRGANRGCYWTPIPENGPGETNSPCRAPHGSR